MKLSLGCGLHKSVQFPVVNVQVQILLAHTIEIPIRMLKRILTVHGQTSWFRPDSASFVLDFACVFPAIPDHKVRQYEAENTDKG